MVIAGVQVTAFRDGVQQAVDKATTRMKDGRVQDEPTLTGSFFSAIEDTFEALQIPKYEVKVRVLRGIGPNAPEHSLGADSICVLKVGFPGYQLSKGFLIQSKWAHEKHISVERASSGYATPHFKVDSEYWRMRGQCERMLKVTPDSFVLVYSTMGFVVVPATAIVATQAGTELPSVSI